MLHAKSLLHEYMRPESPWSSGSVLINMQHADGIRTTLFENNLYLNYQNVFFQYYWLSFHCSKTLEGGLFVRQNSRCMTACRA